MSEREYEGFERYVHGFCLAAEGKLTGVKRERDALRTRVAELKRETEALAWTNYQLCGLACDELGVSADAARATAASRRPDKRGEGE